MTVETFGSVFDALADTRAEAANMTTRAGLLLAIRERVKAWQAMGASREASRRTPRADSAPPQRHGSRGKLDKLSLDALVNIAAAAGFRLHIELEDVKAA
jgi:predicted XRE-type DNA-binding protein